MKLKFFQKSTKSESGYTSHKVRGKSVFIYLFGRLRTVTAANRFFDYAMYD